MLRRLLALALLSGATAIASTRPARAAEIDPLLPKETESVVFVNMKQLVESDLIKKFALGQLKQMVSSNDDVQQILKATGLDPFKDIDRVTLGSWGKDKDDMKAVAVVRGRFDPAKIFEAVKAQAAKDADKLAIVEQKDGESTYKLLKITLESQPKPFYAAVADENTLIGGNDKKLVASTLTSVKEKAKPALKKELGELLLKQDEKSTMFLVGLVPEGQEMKLPPNIPGIDSEKVGKQLEKLRNIAMKLNLTEDVSVEISMGMADADAADDFGGSVDQLIGMVKGFLPAVAGQQPNAKPVVDEIVKTLKSGIKGSDVTLKVKLSGDAIGKASGAGD